MSTLIQQTTDKLRQRITCGHVGHAGQLPSEHMIAREFGVSRCVVRHAFGALERDGLLLRLPGVGRVAAKAALPRPLASDLILMIGSPPNHEANLRGYLNAIDSAAIAALGQQGEGVLAMDLRAITPERIERLIADPPKGVVVGPQIERHPDCMALVHRLADAGAAVVVVVVARDGETWRRYDRVVDDQEVGARELTRHLLALGRTRIALMVLAAEPQAWWQARQRGYRAAMTEAGLSTLPPIPSQSVVERSGSLDPENLANRTRASAGWLAMTFSAAGSEENAPDALIAVTDGDVFPLCEAARLLGRDLIIAGYDNYWSDAWERTCSPHRPVATVDKDNPGMGRLLVRLLSERLADPTLPPRVQVHPPQLVITTYHNL